MAKRKVIWTDIASKQLRSTLNYWKIRNGSYTYSEKILRQTNNRIKVLLEYPESYHTTDYIQTRISAMGYFSILYKVTEREIIISSFWDNRQDPDKLLEIIKEE